VVIGVIALLVSILLPALSAARQQAIAVQCASNLRQIVTAGIAYQQENRGYWPQAHADYFDQNLHRWHGVRASMDAPFEFALSPLNPYLRTDRIKACGAFDAVGQGFEAGAGGYGYNADFIGSSLGVGGWSAQNASTPAKQNMIRSPAEKIAFADTAMAAFGRLIEYSFVEPPLNGFGTTSPSLHFRHRGSANIAWADGHVTRQRMEWTYPHANIYGSHNASFNLGFFGPQDNALFRRD
jgi:prepilin-type processing-associated H-X9-DG protein